jgi:Polyketide cyclase / dehydrase and lipid transport
VRYRDQPTMEVEERVAADPAVIWALVTDIDLPSRFSDELQRVEWLDGASEVAVGNRFRGTNENVHLGQWQTECTVVEVEPERRWVWEVRAGDAVMATWGFELDAGREAVRVRQWARMGPDPSGLNVAIDAMPDKEGRIIANRLREWQRNMAANLRGIKALAEGTPG